MNSKNLKINQAIRRVFVRHWIDLGRLSIRTINGKVHLHGMVERITGFREPLTGSIMDSIINEIRRIRGVIHLTATFDNWTNHDGVWKPTDKRRDDEAAFELKSSRTGGTFKIEPAAEPGTKTP